MAITRFSSIAPQTTTRTVGRHNQSVILMLIVSLLMLGGICSRLVYLQFVEGARNRELADENRIRLIPKQPERGTIMDRKGRLLAVSRLSHSVYLWPLARQKTEWTPTFKRLSQILNVPESYLQKRLEQAKNALMISH